MNAAQTAMHTIPGQRGHRRVEYSSSLFSAAMRVNIEASWDRSPSPSGPGIIQKLIFGVIKCDYADVVAQNGIVDFRVTRPKRDQFFASLCRKHAEPVSDFILDECL